MEASGSVDDVIPIHDYCCSVIACGYPVSQLSEELLGLFKGEVEGIDEIYLQYIEVLGFLV